MIHRPFEPRIELWPLGRFLEYARADRATIAICKREDAARAYRDRLQRLRLKYIC